MDYVKNMFQADDTFEGFLQKIKLNTASLCVWSVSLHQMVFVYALWHSERIFRWIIGMGWDGMLGLTLIRWMNESICREFRSKYYWLVCVDVCIIMLERKWRWLWWWWYNKDQINCEGDRCEKTEWLIRISRWNSLI